MELLPVALVGIVLGTVLGLLGGGGGILAIPLLVHLLGQSYLEASTTSLVVVTVGAMAGLIPHARAGRVDWRSGILFGILGAIGAIPASRAALVADERLLAGGLIVLIAVAAWSMLKPDRPAPTRLVDQDGPPPEATTTDSEPDSHQAPAAARTRAPWWRVVLIAAGVGVITGFFGVGGGFVAVPALIFGAGLGVRQATATGLLVIVINSVIALGARGPALVDWRIAAGVAGFAAVAAVFAAIMSRRVPATGLKRGFGWLLVAVGTYETYVLLSDAVAS